MNQLQILFSSIIEENTFKRMIFSNKRKRSLEYTKVSLRPVMISGALLYQAEFTYPKKVTHENLTTENALLLCLRLVSEDFKQVNIFSASEEIQVLASKWDQPRILHKKTSQQPSALDSSNSNDVLEPQHNRTKNYLIPDGTPCDFLIRLGVMGQDGRVFQKGYRKFRQINRYLEIVDDVFPSLPKDRTLKIIDFGCGKAYLTFALYYYLKVLKERDVEIIGLDLKEDVINFCNQVASDLNYHQLHFLPGDIADYSDDHADMVVTLHACDTATDYALINAVAWNTKVILSVPCCQHQLFKQMKNSLHQPMLKHGILKERLTEYLTDGLRGLKLEAAGYEVSMIEFTSLEHTARNIMIKAIKSTSVGSYAKEKQAKAQAQYDALCEFYQVHPTIDQL